MLFYADPADPDFDPAQLLFFSASISGMEKALKKDPKIIYADIFERKSALHHAAECPVGASADAVRWLLEKGIPWSARDIDHLVPEDLARMGGNEESQKVLREWAVQKEYELYYKTNRYEDRPDEGKPFSTPRMDKIYRNDLSCQSQVLFMNPNGAPEDEVALLCHPDGTGIMMEWERPIMCETARLLLDGMPTSGLRALNIGFRIGMIDTYFQHAHPAEHIIIEGHPTCLQRMRHKGWYDRPGVRVLEGRWQDFFPPPSPDRGSRLPKSR